MDQSSLFKVIYTGQIKEGQTHEEVAQNLQAKLKLPADKAERLVKSQREVTIKQKVEHAKAYTFKTALESAGMIVRLEPQGFVAPKPAASGGLSLVPLEGEEDQSSAEEKAITPAATEQNSEKAAFTCPKCGHEQPTKGLTCQSCGVVFAKLEAMAQAESEGTPPPMPAGLGRTSGKRPLAAAKDEDAEPSFFERAKVSIVGGAGGVVALLIIAKKFKLIKFAALLGAASYGYWYDSIVVEAQELCLGDGACTSIVEDQAEPCWETSGMADHDWEEMDDAEFERLYYTMENEFFGCFTDDAGQRLFLKPTYLTYYLNDLCGYEEACLAQVRTQQHQCYRDSGIELYADELSRLDDYDGLMSRKREVRKFFTCFKDSSRQQLFEGVEYLWEEY